MTQDMKTEITPYLKRMNLNEDQIKFIQEKEYKDWPELFDYVFELGNALDDLKEINQHLATIKEIQNDARIQQGEIMLRIFKLKTQTGFELKK